MHATVERRTAHGGTLKYIKSQVDIRYQERVKSDYSLITNLAEFALTAYGGSRAVR